MSSHPQVGQEHGFGLHEDGGRPFEVVLADALQSRKLLLLLDNCEHVLAACADLSHGLLRACAGLTILATSREPLGIPGETTRRVPSLDWPQLTARPSFEQLRRYASVRLFAERASAASGEFALTESNAAAIADICARLDGIPLAIELAAARVRALSLHQIAERLDDRFGVLGGSARGVLSRHQTLGATVRWSYDLLGNDEQRLLRSLAVFSGAWTLEDAEAVCLVDDAPGSVLDVLVRLVDKSLVLTEEGPDGDMIYRLLEPMSSFFLKEVIKP